MTDPPPPSSLIDGLLRRTRHLLIDFDGPVCDLYAHHPAPLAEDPVRTIFTGHGVEISAAFMAVTDPLTVLSWAADVSRELAQRLEAALTEHELSAVRTAQPAGYLHELVACTLETGRTAAVISACSVRAVRDCLARVNLADQVALVVGRTGYDPVRADRGSLLRHAIAACRARPAECALVAGSAEVLGVASAAGAGTIGYAPAPAARDRLDRAHPGPTITSHADLVLRLRSDPPAK